MEDEVLDVNHEDFDYQNKVASKGTRFGNAMVDGLLIGLPLSFLANYVVFGEWFIESRTMLHHLDLYAWSTLLNYILYVIYYTGMEHSNGKTIGKMVTGTRVVNHKGEKPEFNQIIGRSLARLIPFEAFSFLGEKGIGWHDSMTKTYVIND